MMLIMHIITRLTVNLGGFGKTLHRYDIFEID